MILSIAMNNLNRENPRIIIIITHKTHKIKDKIIEINLIILDNKISNFNHFFLFYSV